MERFGRLLRCFRLLVDGAGDTARELEAEDVGRAHDGIEAG